VDACSESAGACTSAAPDSDGDGVGDASCRDADGLALGTDCDDADPNRYPDNPEVCDAEERDEDCNPLTIGARDDDGDGHISDQCCNVDPDGVRVCGDDCMDDGEPFVHRGAFELCDGLDNDCNGLTDDDIRSRTFGVDCDGDRFGVATDPPIIDCALPTLAVPCEGGTWVPDATDCDDTSASRNPGLTEVCDGLDNNCDPEGAVDEGWSASTTTRTATATRTGTHLSPRAPSARSLGRRRRVTAAVGRPHRPTVTTRILAGTWAGPRSVTASTTTAIR